MMTLNNSHHVGQWTCYCRQLSSCMDCVQSEKHNKSDLQTLCFTFYLFSFRSADWVIEAGKINDKNVGKLLLAHLIIYYLRFLF